MAKNITVKIGDQLQNFQGVEFLKLQTVGSQGDTSFVDQDAVSVLPFTFKFDANGQHNEENIALYQKYKNCVERGLSVNTYINWDGALYPASSIPELNKIYAYTDIGPLDIIEITFGETVQNNIIEVIDTVFDEKKGNPASQQAIAEWVKKYVSKNGGGGAVTDEQIASAVEAYFEENPIEFTETDPTVPSWAKQKNKPSYTASEVGALPSTYTPPDQTAEQVGADPKGTADAKVSSHNTSNASHNDIRLLIESLTTRLNALADSTDEDLDQLSEIVAYIKSNKELIEGVTTNKVSVSDIIDNLTTNVVNKPLSAAQGVALKALIDAITVPTKVSAFDNDKGYITNTELGSVVDSALEEAKESGEFDGDRGFSILRVTTALSAYTTTTGGFTPKYRIALSTVLSESGASEVRIGDTILRNYYTYPVGYVDSSYVYVGAYASIRGLAGTSVTISNITESEVSGGENVVTFSDEKTLTIKNGRDGTPGIPGGNGHTPVKGVDYYTESDKAEFSEYIATELAKRGQLKPEYANSIEECTDTSKMYVLPDGFIYAWMLTEKEVSTGGGYTNLLATAKATDRATIYGGDYNGDGVNDGYKTNTKLSGSGGGESTAGSGKGAMCSSGFIFPVKSGDILRIKGATPVTGSNHYVVGYDSANARTGNDQIIFTTSGGGLIWTTDSSSGKYTLDADGTIVYTINTAKLGANVDAVRICMAMNESTIVTLNEEIKEGGGTTTVIEEDWVSTGLAFVPADYENRIVDLENEVSQNSADIASLKNGVTTAEPIKTWDAPIYDANIPVFELSVEKSAIIEAEKTVEAVYAKYDALMARHPNYITKTNLGMCSDGVTPVYRYDFREPEPHRGTTGKKEWSETKTKAIIVSGIHWEWGGIFGLYNALEEIADNPTLFDLRRNSHLIVLPVCNPYAVANMSVRNANLIEIHRNFEVDFIYPGESGYIELGERSHGGTEPLSEVETQYIDNILKNNTDAALFLTCHSNQSDSVYGTGFTWASPATYYMCNMHYRIVDKLSNAWMAKFGDELADGIADYRTENTPEWDNRLGSAYLSTTNGTETKQATKYGIQATNIEITDAFLTHGTKANPEPALSSFTMSRGAEVYVNFLLTAFGTYDYKDKKEYAPTTI